MAVEDVTSVLVEYCEDGEETFRNLHGGEAEAAVQDMADLIRRELGNQLEYDTLWQEFVSSPRETAADLSGELEAMVEADPGLADQLERLLKEYYATGVMTAGAADGGLPQEGGEALAWEEVPTEPHEAKPSSHTDDAGGGTYLYGNVPSSDITVEKGAEMNGELSQTGGEEPTLRFEVGELFEQLEGTVRSESELSDVIKATLENRLQELEAEIMLEEDADEERIVKYLRRIGELDPDTLELTLTGLSTTRGKAEAVVRRAIEQITGRHGGE